MECPRCVAERRAERLRAVTTIGGALAVLGVAVPCCFAGLLWGGVEQARDFLSPSLVPWAEKSLALLLSALVLAAVVVVLAGSVTRWSRRAATPLPAPPADPLATYREAPPECPRHPFTR